MADFSEGQRDKYLEQLNNPSLTTKEATQIIEEAKKWEEGGIYRVALHTAVGAIGTGTIEGAVTTGSVAAAAPTIDKLSEQLTEQLVKAGISEDTAQNATSLITSLAIATATQSAGVDTTSTAMAVNADAFNRQLHPNEFHAIQIIAEKLGVNEEELKKAILYHIDKGWQDNIAEKEAGKITFYQNLYEQALNELGGRSINGYINDYLDDVINSVEDDPEPSNVTSQQISENLPTVTLEPAIVIINRDFEADKTNLYTRQKGMGFKATDNDFNDGRIFAGSSFGEIRDRYPSLVQDMSAFEKLQETSDGLSAFGNGLVEGGVSNIKGLADAIMNLPNVDISAVRERAYELSSDTIKYLTDSQYRDSVNQEAVYDLQTDIAYGQILALQGDADKIGQVVGEATGKLATDLAVSAGTAGLGKGLVQAVVIAKSADGVIDGANALSRLDANPKTIIDNNVNVDNDSFTHISDLMKKAESTGWKSPDGSIIWPPNNGIVPHTSFNTTIPVGSRLDRYGGTGDSSSYLAPVDVPVDARALSPDTNLLIRDEYIVLKPLPVILYRSTIFKQLLRGFC